MIKDHKFDSFTTKFLVKNFTGEKTIKNIIVQV